MRHDDTVSAYILDTQIALFEDAKADLQISFATMARRAGLVDERGKPNGTFSAWVVGRNAVSTWGIKKLLRIKGNDGKPGVFAPYLSRLFEPEEYALTAVLTIDHDDTAAKCIDFAAEHAKARHPASECGVNIGPVENKRLRSKATALAAAA